MLKLFFSHTSTPVARKFSWCERCIRLVISSRYRFDLLYSYYHFAQSTVFLNFNATLPPPSVRNEHNLVLGVKCGPQFAILTEHDVHFYVFLLPCQIPAHRSIYRCRWPLSWPNSARNGKGEQGFRVGLNPNPWRFWVRLWEGFSNHWQRRRFLLTNRNLCNRHLAHQMKISWKRCRTKQVIQSRIRKTMGEQQASERRRTKSKCASLSWTSVYWMKELIEEPCWGDSSRSRGKRAMLDSA